MQLRARLKVGNGWIHSCVQPSLPLQPLHKDHHQFINQNTIATTKTTEFQSKTCGHTEWVTSTYTGGNSFFADFSNLNISLSAHIDVKKTCLLYPKDFRGSTFDNMVPGKPKYTFYVYNVLTFTELSMYGLQENRLNEVCLFPYNWINIYCCLAAYIQRHLLSKISITATF